MVWLPIFRQNHIRLKFEIAPMFQRVSGEQQALHLFGQFLEFIVFRFRTNFKSFLEDLENHQILSDIK